MNWYAIVFWFNYKIFSINFAVSELEIFFFFFGKERGQSGAHKTFL